jgi:hypothetical protein
MISETSVDKCISIWMISIIKTTQMSYVVTGCMGCFHLPRCLLKIVGQQQHGYHSEVQTSKKQV